MEELRAKHRKEQKELQGKITQKKKSATKKTRKGVNDECETLERELKARQDAEIATVGGTDEEQQHEQPSQDERDELDLASKKASSQIDGNTLAADAENLSINDGQSNGASVTLGDNETRGKKPNRQKARLARRALEQEAAAEQAAAEASNLPDLREKEHEAMLKHLQTHKLQEKVIRADGHCLFSAIADQLEHRGLGLTPRIDINVKDTPRPGVEAKDLPDYKVVRAAAADFIEENKDDFEPFLEEPLFTYVHKVRDTGEWGGHMELLALARTYGVPINVLHGDGRVDKIESSDGSEQEPIWLGYYRHGFGLGEHYNSLRRAP